MAVLCAERERRRIAVVTALRFALAHAWPVLRVAGRMVGATLLAVAPFAAVLGLTFYLLLGDRDINFYLKERPPAFLAALGIGGVAAVAMAAVLLRLFTGWFYALPLVLFEDVPSAVRSPPAAIARVAIARRSSRGSRAGRWRWRRSRLRATSITVWLARAFVPRPRIRWRCSRWRSAPRCLPGPW